MRNSAERKAAVEFTDVGKMIRRKRKALNWTQEQLAAKARMDKQYLSRIERGKQQPSLNILEDIAKAFGSELIIDMSLEKKTEQQQALDELISTLKDNPEKRNITVLANSVTKIPPVTLERAMGSDYFYHFVHTFNILTPPQGGRTTFAVLLTTGIGAYYLRNKDRVGKVFLRFCLIMSFWSLWGIVSYVLEPIGKKEIGGHLTYLSLWAYSLIGVTYCHLFAVFPQPILREKTSEFLSWLYFPAVSLFPFEFIRIFFWYRPDYSRFLGFPQEITDAVIMAFFILYLVKGNAFLLVNLRRVKERAQKIQLFFLFIAACFPPALLIGTMGAMYLFRLDYFFDNDMLFLTSLCDITIPVFFGYSLVLFEYFHTIDSRKCQ